MLDSARVLDESDWLQLLSCPPLSTLTYYARLVWYSLMTGDVATTTTLQHVLSVEVNCKVSIVAALRALHVPCSKADVHFVSIWEHHVTTLHRVKGERS